MSEEYVKIVVFVPITHADAVREALAESGCGRFNKYEACSFSCRGIGRFRPLEGSDPFIGTTNELQEVEEERIEVICLKSDYPKALAITKKAHPYEEPAIEVYSLISALI